MLIFGVVFVEWVLYSLVSIAHSGSEVSIVLPGRKVFWDPNRCGHWVFQVKCVYRY